MGKFFLGLAAGAIGVFIVIRLAQSFDADTHTERSFDQQQIQRALNGLSPKEILDHCGKPTRDVSKGGLLPERTLVYPMDRAALSDLNERDNREADRVGMPRSQIKRKTEVTIHFRNFTPNSPYGWENDMLLYSYTKQLPCIDEAIKSRLSK